MISALFLFHLWVFFPITTEFTAWYASDFTIGLAICVALAVYGFYTSLAGQTLLAGSCWRIEVLILNHLFVGSCPPGCPGHHLAHGLGVQKGFAEAGVGDIGGNAVDDFCCAGKCIARRGHITQA